MVDGAAWHRRQSAELRPAPRARPGCPAAPRARGPRLVAQDVPLEQSLPRLHKAAHFARKALGPGTGILELRHDVVALAVGHTLRVDAVGSRRPPAERWTRSRPLGRVRPAGPAQATRPCSRLGGGVARRAPRASSGPGGRAVGRCGAVGDAAEDRRRQRDRAPGAAEGRPAPWRPVCRAARLRRHGADPRGGAAGDARCGRARPARRPLVEALDAGDEDDLTTVGLRTPPRAANALVERGRELESLQACVAAARETGRGSLVLVSGDPGVGKSALVRAFIDGLADHVTAHVGGCDDLVAPRSLGPFQDMVADPAARDSGVRTIVEAGTMPEVLPALPGVPRARTVRRGGRGPALGGRCDPRRDAVPRPPGHESPCGPGRHLPRQRPRRRPPVDAPARHPARRPRRAAAAGAPLGCCCPCPRWLQRRRGRRGASITGGNPSSSPGHRRRRRSGPDHGARRRPRQDRRVATRGQGAAAEALRDPGPRGTVARRSLTTGSEALVLAEASGVLLGDPEGLSFRHELARRAVESSLTTTERRAAHREVLDVLLEVPGVSRARLVHHAAFGGRGRVLVEIGPEAAAEAARQAAHRQCAEILRLVLESPHTLSDQRAARLWSERSYSSYVVNRFEAAFSVRGDRGGPGGPCRRPAGADGCASGARQGGDVRARAGGGAHGGAAVGRRVAE